MARGARGVALGARLVLGGPTPFCIQVGRIGKKRPVDTALGIVLLLVSLASVTAVAVAFVWAARKDGEADRALQRRLGIRRRTRLGR